MIIQDLIGDYSISGRNQDEDREATYKGVLSLSLDENNRIIAKWLINNTDEQKGSGFLKTTFWSLISAIKENTTKSIREPLFTDA